MKPKSVYCVRPDKLAMVCAWCSDKHLGDCWAMDRGYDLSHGICPSCSAKEKRALLKARRVPHEPTTQGTEGATSSPSEIDQTF